MSSGLVERIRDLGITDVVVWGLKSNTHTHHYIHRAVYKCFSGVARSARVRVRWYDDIELIPPPRRWRARDRKYLFFSSPHYDTDRHIPLLEGARYILHADWSRSWTNQRPISQYEDHAFAGRAVYWRVFRGFPTDGFVPLAADELTFFNPSERRLTMAWATDLLPHQVSGSMDEVTARFAAGRLFPGSRALFVGSVWSRNEQVMDRFEAACARRGLRFSVQRIDAIGDTMEATRNSYMAPAIQGEGHRKSQTEFYVPCRIFKNISYGALGVTNNEGVHGLFDKRLVYDEDEDLILDRYAARVAGFDELALDEMLDLMQVVRDRHTYVNRLTHCLQQIN